MRSPIRICARRRSALLPILAVMLIAGPFGPCAALQADFSSPGPYHTGWVTVSVTRPGGGSFNALLFYPASVSGTGAAYDGGGAPYPAISFGHGWITAVTQYQSTLEHLASWGYFVIASQSYGGLFPDHSAFADDLRWCLTYLETRNSDPISWLFQQVDVDNFGLSGHSMGGGAGILAAERDQRVRALANLAAAETNPSAINAVANVQIPLCLIAGSQDSIAPPASHALPIYNNAFTARRLPMLLGGWHCGFLDSNIFGCDSGAMPRATQLALARELLTAFFNLYLKNDQSAWRQVWGPESHQNSAIDNSRMDPNFMLSPHVVSASGYEGRTAQLDFILTNLGPLPAAYSLHLEDNLWSAGVNPAQTAVLNPGATAAVAVAIDVPANSPVNLDELLLSARSERDGGTRTYAVIAVTRLWLGDLNADGLVDAVDFGLLVECLLGPETPILVECVGADLDGDSDVDLADFAEFQTRFGLGS